MFILGENKKYIDAIFNILDDNKNILVENNLFLCVVGRFLARRGKMAGVSLKLFKWHEVGGGVAFWTKNV